MNCELPDIQAGFRKGRTRDRIANIHWIIKKQESSTHTHKHTHKKQESSRKTSTSALLAMPKPLTEWITEDHGKILKKMGIPDHLTCILRNLYAGQEATVRPNMEQ